MSVIEKIMCGKAFPAAGLTGRPVAEPAVERTIETLQRYHRLGVLCLAAGILWLILAIFLYMYFRMGRVIGSLTGYRERKAIRKWEETELLRIECKKDEEVEAGDFYGRLCWQAACWGRRKYPQRKPEKNPGWRFTVGNLVGCWVKRSITARM